MGFPNFTHPGDPVVKSSGVVNTASNRSLSIGKNSMNGPEIKDNLSNAITATSGRDKTQEQKMKEAGIDLEQAGMTSDAASEAGESD